jgi:hypothetical protein
MFKGIYDRPLVKPFARVLGAIPISAELRPRELIRSLRTAGDAIREGLVVLHKLADGQLQSCLEKLVQSDLPNLWKPRTDQFFRVEAFPYLGSGKLDLRKVRELAQLNSQK